LCAEELQQAHSNMQRLKAIREALEQSPHNLSLLLLYGHSSLEELSLEEAREAFTRVLELDVNSIDGQLGMARTHLLEGDASGAAVRAERVLQMHPGHAGANLLLSRINLTEGNRSAAMDYFKAALKADAAITDAALEAELGKAAVQARRNTGPVPTLDYNAAEGFNSGTDLATDPFDDPFLDEADDDWKPETFFAPGDTERTRVNFDSVGGMEELKEEIRLKIVYPLQHPDLYKAYGRKAGGGILIFGPPGCGKTLLLRAVAGEVGCNYFAISLHEIFDPYFGSSERNLHQVFETARSNAPCVLVFDEIDSLAVDRRHVRESQMRNLVNQFLSELDGIRADNSRILVIGATNAPWNLDPAFRRPGRFDQTIFVPPPDLPARAQIIELLAKERPISQLDVDALAKVTKNFTGADLQWVFDRAAELALSEAVHTGRPVPMSMDLLLDVAKQHSPTTSTWFDGVRTHAKPDSRDGLYNEVRKFLSSAPSPTP
jgi:transitional endoplasmic reticulum ATPase